MTVQTTVGGAVLGTVVGATAAQGQVSTPVLVAQSTRALAFTGASDTMMLVALAAILIMTGLLLNGLSRRHAGLTEPGGRAVMGPPLIT